MSGLRRKLRWPPLCMMRLETMLLEDDRAYTESLDPVPRVLRVDADEPHLEIAWDETVPPLRRRWAAAALAAFEAKLACEVDTDLRMRRAADRFVFRECP